MHYDDFLNMDALKKYAAAMNQRAASKGASGRVTAEILRSLILESAGKCGWCDVSVVKADFEIDHIETLSHGGSNDATNLAITCPDCNRRKAEKHPATFAQEQIAQSGITTLLISRILTFYNITSAPQQRSLFGDE